MIKDILEVLQTFLKKDCMYDDKVLRKKIEMILESFKLLDAHDKGFVIVDRVSWNALIEKFHKDPEYKSPSINITDYLVDKILT